MEEKLRKLFGDTEYEKWIKLSKLLDEKRITPKEYMELVGDCILEIRR